MKTSKMIFILIVLFVHFSCEKNNELGTSEQEIPKSNMENKMVMIEAFASSSSSVVNTRIGITDTLLIWEESDSIHIRVGNQTSDRLILKSGSGTTKGIFSGQVKSGNSSSPMYAYYGHNPEEGVDLTVQTGTKEDAFRRMVLFSKIDAFTTEPSFEFSTKTSILKLEFDAPADLN